jgi:hypothetical protein
MPIYQLRLYWSTTTYFRVFETDAVLWPCLAMTQRRCCWYIAALSFSLLKKQSTEDITLIQRP